MKFLFLVIIILPVACSSLHKKEENSSYKELAQRVTIIRDRWGIPHIYGKTDTDAVFGLMQCCRDRFKQKIRSLLMQDIIMH
ncbi:MAG TPA: penicillin acylase family protein [Chitinophagaceae bacterium]